MNIGRDTFMAYPIKLHTFEGPLDLLLHLIDQAEVDIYDIPIAEITDQYLNYLYNMQNFEIEIASEFLVMAATLLAIKSRMLLPKHEMIDGDSLEDTYEHIDPREELILRLIEYKRYKTASEKLKELEFERNQIYTKPPEDLSYYQTDNDNVPHYNVSILQLFVAFQSVVEKYRHVNRTTRIMKEETSVNDKMTEIIVLLQRANRLMYFTQLFVNIWGRSEVVVTFLALLELMKQNKIKVVQSNSFTDIEIALL